MEEYFHFAYLDETNIHEEKLEDVLEFAFYLNSTEILDLVENFMCGVIDSSGFEQADQYSQIADKYMLEKVKKKLENLANSHST